MKHIVPQMGSCALLVGVLLVGPQPVLSQTLAMTRQVAQRTATVQASITLRSLKDVLNELKVRHKVDILFEDRTIAGYTLPVSVLNERGSFETVLSRVLEPFSLRYKRTRDGAYLILAPKPLKKTAQASSGPQFSAPTALPQIVPLMTQLPSGTAADEAAQPQDITVRGRVTDGERGEGLPGVSISVKGTSRGTTTDANGNFQLAVPTENSTLVFSYIGYEPQEIVVGKQTTLSMVLKASNATLNEVVVVGYGTQNKRDITGAVASVSAQQIKAVPVIGADQALQGRVSGVQVVQTSGAPGGAVQVRVRGVNSTAGGGANQPLYVVDGIPLAWNEGANTLSVGNEGSTGGAGSNGASPLASINPNDIESIEVLKDASATAIYGSRAANGVVLITTKSGKAGKTQISVDAYYGVQSLRRKIPMTNSRERMSYVFEHRRNAATRGNEVFDIWAINPFLYDYEGTDWQNEMFRQAAMQNYSISATGGTEKLQFAVSGDYFNQQGILLNTYAKRYSTRINLDVKATDKLKFGTRTALSLQQGNGQDTDEFFQSQLAYPQSPLSPVYDSNGNFAGRPNNIINGNLFSEGGSNQVANLMQRKRLYERYRIISNLYGEYEITKGLTFRSSFGIDYLFNELNSTNPVWQRGVDVNNVQTVFISQPKTFNWLADQILTYNRTFGPHSLNAVAGFSAQQFTQRTMGASAQGAPSNVLDQLGNQPTPTLAFGGQTPSALVSQFVRANYSFRDKYLFTGTVRRDGSSRFGSNYKYGIFPSFSLGWRVSEEPFLKKVAAIQELKLRASYGSTGNQNIGDFLYAALMGGANTVWGNAVATGLAPGRFENQDIQWERNNQLDVGLDLSLWSGRLNLTVDYYDKLTTGLLGSAPLSVISGVGNAYTTNIGKIRNRGFEFGLNATVLDKNGFRWTLDGNIATNQNRVESLGNLPFINGAVVWRTNSYINRTQVGQPIGGFYVPVESGQYQTWAEAADAPTIRIGAQPYFTPGDFKPVDQNGDKIINDDDRVWYGSPFPDFFGGFGSTWSYKGLSLNVVANFQHGNLLWNQPRLQSEVFEQNAWRVSYENRWKPWEPQATNVPVPRANNPLLPSNRFLEDASFLRIRTITLGYDLPRVLTDRAKLNRARVYVQANNFFTFTRYTGWDPEVNSFGSSVTTNGIDIGAYPIAKSFTVGLSLGF